MFSKDDLPDVVKEGLERVQDAFESGLSFVFWNREKKEKVQEPRRL